MHGIHGIKRNTKLLHASSSVGAYVFPILQISHTHNLHLHYTYMIKMTTCFDTYCVIFRSLHLICSFLNYNSELNLSLIILDVINSLNIKTLVHI